jgi:hypothetical protein
MLAASPTGGNMTGEALAVLILNLVEALAWPATACFIAWQIRKVLVS